MLIFGRPDGTAFCHRSDELVAMRIMELGSVVISLILIAVLVLRPSRRVALPNAFCAPRPSPTSSPIWQKLANAFNAYRLSRAVAERTGQSAHCAPDQFANLVDCRGHRAG
ncbi:MAG: hypothetical protein R3A10_14875 [Caldilineaceae bacterium]